MRFFRNRAGWISAIALAWHVVAIAIVSAVISCDQGPSAEHAGMEDCPMQHKSEPACPLHAEKHGTHDCDCPSIGCSQTDVGFMAVFGAVGVLPSVSTFSVPLELSSAAPFVSPISNRLAPAPQSPPPRT